MKSVVENDFCRGKDFDHIVRLLSSKQAAAKKSTHMV